MRIPVSSGIYADTSPDLRVAYPVNMEPQFEESGISSGYLRCSDGLLSNGEASGVCRGGIEWRGTCYRVMGTDLVSISETGVLTVLGRIPGVDLVSMTYSFDRLAIAADDSLFYYDGLSVTRVTDPDLGRVLDVKWADGYFVTTDGEFLVVTELTDPTQVDPLKYGSSEVDPDPILAVLKIRNEIYSVNRHTIEAFSNVGGTGFPFQRISGAQITRGAVGTHAVKEYLEALVFVGSGREEAVGVFIGANGASRRISTPEVDKFLAQMTDSQLAQIHVEKQIGEGNELVIIHTPLGTVCYDAATSRLIQRPVWFFRSSGRGQRAEYRGRHLVRCYNRWLVADSKSGAYGSLDRSVRSHWGDKVGWEFGVPMVYNNGAGAIVHELEMVALTGAAPLGADPRVTAEYSPDGVTWSQPRAVRAGKQGQRRKRIVWTRQGAMADRRTYRFRGDSDAPLSVLAIEANIEALAW